MTYCPPATAPEVRAGRRAVQWWWYCNSPRSGSALPQATLQGYRGFAGHPHTGWTVRVSHPRRRFARSTGKGARGYLVHRVRDQLVGEHRTMPEARLTRYLCGASSFHAELQHDAAEVCIGCEVAHSRRHVLATGALR